MSTPLYDSDVQKMTDRTQKTTMVDTDVFVVANASGTLAPITKVNTKTTLGIDDTEDRLDTLEGADTTEGSVAKSIKDNAENATFTPAVGSGITSVKVVDAINEVGSSIENIAYRDIPSFRKDITITGSVNYSILTTDNRLLGSHYDVLTKFDQDLVASWARADIVLTGRPEQDELTGYIYCPTVAGLKIITSAGVDVDLWSDILSVSSVALGVDDYNRKNATNGVYTTHTLGAGAIGVAKRSSAGVVEWSKTDFTNPMQVLVNRSGVYVEDFINSNICRKYATNGTVNVSNGGQTYVKKMAINKSGDVFLFDYNNNGVYIKNYELITNKLFYLASVPYIKFILPIDFDNSGRLFISTKTSTTTESAWGYMTSDGNRVQIESTGVYRAIYGGLFDNEKYLYLIETGLNGTEEGKTYRYTQYHEAYNLGAV